MPRPIADEATISGPELARLVEWRLWRVAVIANGLGALVALAFVAFLVPVTTDSDDYPLLAAGAVASGIYLGVTLWLGRRLAQRKAAPMFRWLEAERPASEEERQVVLRHPFVWARISAFFWALGAVLLGLVTIPLSGALAASVAVTVLLGGASTCALGYLLVERMLRWVTGQALAGEPPRSPMGPGVAGRLTMAWMLATGVPLLGVAALAVAEIAGAELGAGTLAAGSLFLALVAITAGWLGIVVAAKSVADPVASVREGMARVEREDLDARVTVDDGSEVGLLQAGFNHMATGLAERERMRDLFGRHVGQDVARAALDGEVELGGEVREVAVLFVDIVGSTSLAARRPPEEVVALLNSFFAIVVEAAERHGGWINKFEGDAALAVFGAPTEREDAAGDALAAARELRARLAAEVPELDAGVGVSAGRAVAGNVGAEQRYEYTVIGDPVNEAARLCELAKQRPERVLASEAALERAGETERSRWSFGEAVTLRGRPAETRLASPRISPEGAPPPPPPEPGRVPSGR